MAIHFCINERIIERQLIHYHIHPSIWTVFDSPPSHRIIVQCIATQRPTKTPNSNLRLLRLNLTFPSPYSHALTSHTYLSLNEPFSNMILIFPCPIYNGNIEMTWFSPEVLCQISMSLVSAQFHHQKEPTFFDDQQKDYGFTVLLNFSIISKNCYIFL